MIILARGPEVALNDRRLLEQYIAPADQRLALVRPEPLRGARAHVLMQALVCVAHPRVDELRPVLARQITIPRQSRCLNERQRTRGADKRRRLRALEMCGVKLDGAVDAGNGGVVGDRESGKLELEVVSADYAHGHRPW